MMMFKQKTTNPSPIQPRIPWSLGAQHARLRRAPLEPCGDILTGAVAPRNQVKEQPEWT